MEELKINYKRLWTSIILGVVGLLILYLSINSLRINYVINRQEAFSKAKLETAKEKLTQNYRDFEEDWKVYDDFISQKVNMLVYLLDKGNSDLDTISTNWGLDVAYIVDENGNVLNSVNSSYTNLNDAGLERFVQYIKGEDDHTYKTVDGVCYYISKLDNGNYLIGGKKSSEMIALQDEKLTWAYSLDNITVGENGYILVEDLDSQTIVYSKNLDVIGKAYGQFIQDDNSTGRIYTTDGYYYSAEDRITLDSKEYRLLALVSMDELLSSTNMLLYSAILIYVIAVALIITYSFMLKGDMLNSDVASSIKYKHLKDDYFINYSMYKRLASVGLIGILIVFLSSIYFSELANTSRQKNLSNIKLEDVENLLKEDEERSTYLSELFNEEYLERAKNISWTLNYDLSLLNDETLKEMADILNIPSINVYDELGNMAYTNTNYKDLSLTSDDGFMDVVKGYKDSLIKDVNDEDIVKEIGVTRNDSKGMVEINLSNDLLKKQLSNTGLTHVLEDMSNENNVWLISVNSETGLIEYCPSNRKIGLSYEEYGLSENCLKDEYVGWKTVDSKKVFLVSMVCGNSIIYTSVLNSSIVSGCLSLSLITSLICLILLSLIIFISCITGKNEISESIRRSKKKKARKAYYTVVSEDGTLVDKEAVEARWSNNHIDFDDLDAGQKLKRIISLICVVLFFGFVVVYLSGVISDTSLLGFIESKNWEMDVNLFSIAYVLIMMMEVIVLAFIVKYLIRLLSKPFNARVNTFAILLESFVKYAAAIYILIEALHSFGVDTTTLIAGLGILTLVVGLGANSLIEDILEGIFIVFEGDFRVGDVVTIDDWRGIVEEIGIRTTKLVGFDKNVKIIRNSAIDSIINMTSQYSLASVDINVASYENLQEVEKVIEARFDHMRKEIPQIIGKIWIEGVIAYDQGSCTIRVTAPCYEEDRDDVLNRFYREFKLIYDENPDIFKYSDYSSINIVK